IRTTCSWMIARWTATSSGCGASSAPWTRNSTRSPRSTGPDTASPMPDGASRGTPREHRLDRLAFSRNTSLTARILTVNLVPLMLLAGSLFFIDSYRRQLLDERYRLAQIEAQITAEALAGATRERQEALLIQIGKEQRMRLRIYDAQGNLTADSFA